MCFLKTNGFLDVQFSINPVCSEAHIQNAQMDEGGMCTTLKHEHTTLGWWPCVSSKHAAVDSVLYVYMNIYIEY